MRALAATWPFILRALAMALGAFAVSWGITGNAGLFAGMGGAVAGTLLGHLLARRTRVRLPILLVSCVLVTVGLCELASLAAETTFVPRTLGPTTAIVVIGLVKYAAVALGFTTALRLIAARKPSFVAVELLSLAIAISIAFSAHRDGMLSRPLWLADFAWRNGIDPTMIFLGIGFVSAGLLATVLLVEMKSRRAISSLFALAAIAALVMLFVNVVGTPKPPPDTDIPVTTEQGDEPPPQDAGTPYDAAGNDEGGQGEGGEGEGGQGEGGGEGGQGDGAADGGQGDGAADGGGGEMDADLPDVAMHDIQPKEPKDPKPDPNPRPAAIVILEDDYTPPMGGYYLRNEAMSQFNGSRLVPTSRSDADRDTITGFPTEETTVLDPPPSADLTSLLPDGGVAPKKTTPRKLIHTRIALLTPHSGPFALEGEVALSPMPNPAPATFNRVYHANSLAMVAEYDKFFGRTLGNPKWSPELRAYYTQGPTDPRYKELATQLIEKAHLKPQFQSDMFAKAAAIKMGLDDMLTYTIKASHTGPDPAGEMLFSKEKIGYCVHFAHAAVFLWRSMGIPARAGTGYMVEEDDRDGPNIAVMSNRQHMWPEIYVDGVGWVVFDISAKKNLDKATPRPPRDLTKLLADLAKQIPPDSEKMKEGKYCFDVDDCGCDCDEKGKSCRTWCNIRRASLWSGIVVGSVLLLLYAIKLWRRLAPPLTTANSLPRVGYRAALDVVGEIGFAREFGESREAFAGRVKPVAPSFEKITYLHLAAKFRGDAIDRKTRPEYSHEKWAKLLGDLRKEVGRKRPGWRIALGRLHPFSFIQSR